MLSLTSIDARHGGGGSKHDSFGWAQSKANRYLESEYDEGLLRDYYLLGDIEYPLDPWIITPYELAAPNSSEEKYNNVQRCALHCVKRTIDILKVQWRILNAQNKTRYSPDKFLSVMSSDMNLELFLLSN